MVLEIDDRADTISGRLSIGDAPASVFYGWLELIDRLDRAAPGSPGPPNGAHDRPPGSGDSR